MVKIAALLLVVGSGCHLMHPSGIWTNNVCFVSIFTATFAVLAASENCEILRTITIISAAITTLFIMFGFISIIKEVQDWTVD